jgi:hypothetical protein
MRILSSYGIVYNQQLIILDEQLINLYQTQMVSTPNIILQWVKPAAQHPQSRGSQPDLTNPEA